MKTIEQIAAKEKYFRNLIENENKRIEIEEQKQII